MLDSFVSKQRIFHCQILILELYDGGLSIDSALEEWLPSSEIGLLQVL